MANSQPPFVPKATPAPVTPVATEVVDAEVVETTEKKARAPQIKYSHEDIANVIPLVSSKSPADISRELGMEKKVVARIIGDARKVARNKAVEASGGKDKAYVIVDGLKPGTRMPDYNQPISSFAKVAEEQIAKFLTPPVSEKKATGGPRAPRSTSKSNLFENADMKSLLAAIEGSNA